MLCFSSKQRNDQHILDGEIDHVISTLDDADDSLFMWFYEVKGNPTIEPVNAKI